MCGITGLLSFNNAIENKEIIISRMLKAIQHRGPDGAGSFSDNNCTLGHRRLAVIDTTDAAKQPMTINGVTLVYNGELYNFLEEKKILESKGIIFFSNSDSEVLLEMYLYYGESFLQRLRGMYSFAIWDSRVKKIICARDPLGIKPFLYSFSGGIFIFASELKSILASGMISKEIDNQALNNLLSRGSIPQPDTILRDVKSLLPGEYLTINEGNLPVYKRFHNLQINKIDLNGIEWPELVALGREKLLDSLTRQMISDVPLGAFLSGGIDSSLLVALMAQNHNNVKTFSVGFETGLNTLSDDETADAENVARHLGVDHTTIIVEQNEIADNLRNIARGLDHPTVDGVNSWFVSRAARSDLTVAISGTGGDELFAGYPWFDHMRQFENVSYKEKIKRKFKNITFNSEFEKQYFIFNDDTVKKLFPGKYKKYNNPDPLQNADSLSRVTGMVLSGYTRDQLLNDIDTAAMSHGLEVRVPLLDEDLLDFALSLPQNAKIGNQDTTAQNGSYAATGLKRILIDIGYPLLPKEFSTRAKRGFTLPFDGWLKNLLADDMESLLSYQTVKKRGVFNPIAVNEIKDNFKNNKVHWTQPWLLMMTELWAQEVLD